MANVSDYTFNNMSRIGLDRTTMNENDVQNVKSGNYNLTNYNTTDCEMTNVKNFALNQPNVFYNGAIQVGGSGCNIDTHSNLTIGSEQTNPAYKLALQQRIFSTVPFLGRGKVEVDTESSIKQGDSYTNRKSVNPSSEVSYLGYSQYPLIPSIKESVANPANALESSVDSDWIRGGLPSRDLVRDTKQFN